MKQYVIAWMATLCEDRDSDFGMLDMEFGTYEEAKKHLTEEEVPSLKKSIEEHYMANAAVDIEITILDNANEQPYVGSVLVLLNGSTEEYYQYKICCIEKKTNKLLNGIRV